MDNTKQSNKRIKAKKKIEIQQIGKPSRNFTSSTKNTKKAYNNYNKSKFIKKSIYNCINLFSQEYEETFRTKGVSESTTR